MEKKSFHILYSCPDQFPDEVLDLVTKDLKTEGLVLEANKRKIGPWACLEWAIPGAIIAYLAKPYFDGFLKEAGKDHYQIVKKWLKKIAIDSRLIITKKLVSDQSPDKIDINNSQSDSISIYLETKHEIEIKLLFDLKLDNEVWERSIDKILGSFLDHYENYPNDIITKKLKQLEGFKGGTVYAIIDSKTHDWEFFSDSMLFKKERNRNGS